MKVKIEEKEEKLYVKISLRMNEKRSKIMVKDVLKILKEKGWDTQPWKCIQTATVTNRSPTRCVGVFIFEKLKPTPKSAAKPVAPKTKKRRAPSRRKKSK